MITFIASASDEKFEIPQFIVSLLLQTDPRWKCIICFDEPHEYGKKVIDFFNDDRISYIENPIRTGYWGNFNRKKALEELADTEFVILTQVDEYYLQNSVDLILQNSQYDFMYFNHICRYSSTNLFQLCDTRPEVSGIDISCYVTRTSLAKTVINQLDLTWSGADGKFAEICVNTPGVKFTKLDRFVEGKLLPLVVKN
jgi:hypothetical protein